MFDTAQQGRLPPDLDEMEPGLMLAAFLAKITVSDLSGHDRVIVLRAHQRMASYYTAQVYQDMAAVSDALSDIDDDAAIATEAAAAEIRAALRLTRRAADTELSLALDLHRRLPRVLELLATGDIDPRRAWVMIRGTAHLPITTARTIVDQILEDAPRLTTGQLAAHLRRHCIEVDPQQATDRYRHAVVDRRVITEPNPDGTANLLGLNLPPHRVAAITRTITQLAQHLRSRDETRTLDQLRADVLLDLLQTTTPTGTGTGKPSTGARGIVDIHVDLETLTRLLDHPGELAGYGPVIADIARQTTEQQPQAEWRYTLTHPDTGAILANGTTRRRPTTRQRRHLQTHQPTCIFPGCRMPATTCDLDHRTPHAQGGQTLTSNLAPLCRHDHHIIRHQTGWTHQPQPNGDHHWTSTLGHTYTTSGRPP